VGSGDVLHSGGGGDAEHAHEVHGVGGVAGLVEDAVLAELGGAQAQGAYELTCKPNSTTSWPSRTTAPGSPLTDSHRDQISQLTPGELDRYAAQLARCLKALATTAPIRAHVQDELAAVRAEQDARPTADAPAEPAASTTPTG